MVNPKDPLLKTGPERQADLFKAACSLASGYSAEDVISVAVNLLVNALRQTNDTRSKAALRFDQISAHTKELLMNQYNGVGRLNGVYSFDQTIAMPLHDARPRIIR